MEENQDKELSPEEVEALSQKAAQVDALSAKLSETEGKLGKAMSDFAALQRAARLQEFTQKASEFKAIPSTGEKFAEDLMGWADALGEGWPKLEALLMAAEKALGDSELLKQKGSGKTDERTESEKFGAEVKRVQDEQKVDYAKAVEVAARNQPALYSAYVTEQRAKSKTA